MRDRRLELRCTDAELATWRSQAVLDGRTLSSWIRDALNDGDGREHDKPAELEPEREKAAR
jgi:hypothetical protein